MTKATTTAVDFLGALSCEPEIFETDGVTVELRSLTFVEAQQIATKYKGDSTEMMFQTMARGLVAPKLTDEQIAELRQKRPGPLTKIANRVMEISGMLEDNGPLAPGSGSSSQ